MTGLTPFFNMAFHLFEKSQSDGFINMEQEDSVTALSLRVTKNHYITLPENENRLESYRAALPRLKCEAAMIINSSLIRGFISKLSLGTVEVPFSSSERVQVIESLNDLHTVRIAQQAAFVINDRVLVIWADEVDDLRDVARQLSSTILSFIMQGMQAQPIFLKDRTTRLWSAAQTRAQMRGISEVGEDGQPCGAVTPASSHLLITSLPHPSAFLSEKSDKDPFRTPSIASKEAADERMFDEEATQLSSHRPISTQAPLLQGLAVAINIFSNFILIRGVLIRYIVDGQAMRLAAIALCPIIFVLGAFFYNSVVSLLFLLIGPIKQMTRNSRYYSGVAPPRITRNLPHITIQMPVYKESIDTVIAPTIRSLRAAIRTYELQGGTASIIVSDDGMKLLNSEQKRHRKQYYDENDVTWVARPANGHDDYIRRGRFKKASNLNFTCQIAIDIEARIQKALLESPDIGEHERRSMSEALLDECLHARHPASEGSGDVRIGEFILLVDSDTRVPEDCLLDAASELRTSPELAILQHCSGVMIADGNYFEKGIAFFTKVVNFSISVCTSRGDIAPFMGHNAFLRWSALQSVLFSDAADPEMQKVWSDTRVSEDFDMALRLLSSGMTVRWATYSNNGFLEGVSLSAEDELNRWQKYAYGCSELIFNELRYWPTRGPFTQTIRKFMWAKIPIHYKFSAFSYLFSYYALSVTVPFSILLYIAWGWFAPVMDIPILSSYQVWLSVLIVYSLGSTIGLMIARIRSRTDTAVFALVETAKWFPFMVVFFSGISWHILVALLAHPFSINMTWGATLKDLEQSNFFIELPRMFKRYWGIFLVAFGTIGGVIALAVAPLPSEYYIGSVTFMLPPLITAIGHVLYPLLLNPSLLRFSF